MKRTLSVVILALSVLTVRAVPAQPVDAIGKSTESYFAKMFDQLRLVAERKPTVDTLRDDMKQLADSTPGFFGGTLIDTNFVIRQVYNRGDFLARGYDLKKVSQLDYFWDLMRKNPAPQVSEPGHGNIVQPRLIAMRYPVLTDGHLESIVSVMVRTEAFLQAVGLDQCRGYRITCRGVLAEEHGDLNGTVRKVELKLPSNDWVIEYAR